MSKAVDMALEMQPGELTAMAEARGNIYRFLASLYLHPPSREQVDALAKGSLLEDLAHLVGSAPVRLLHHFAQDFDGDYEALEVEYNSLFTVPLDQYVEPYESAYRNGLVGGVITREVLRFYEKAGAAVAERYPELPDHLGAELDFMSFLCDQEAQAWTQKQEQEGNRLLSLEKEFLEMHLLTWIDAVCDRIETKAKSLLYGALAVLTRGFVLSDARTVQFLGVVSEREQNANHDRA